MMDSSLVILFVFMILALAVILLTLAVYALQRLASRRWAREWEHRIGRARKEA